MMNLVTTTMTNPYLPKLGTNLVTALSGLYVNDFSHDYGFEVSFSNKDVQQTDRNGCRCLSN